MWLQKNASIKDYVKYFLKRKGIRIGFCPASITKNSFLKPYYSIYYKIQASTKFRVNDIIYYSLYSNKINARLYHPFGKYDILIFQKNFSKKAYSIASKYKKRGTKIILDINVNYFNLDSKRITKKQNKDILNFINITDKIITTTDYLKNIIIENNIFSIVEVIPEILPDYLFTVVKRHEDKEEINFLYVGYTVKAIDLELIKETLEKLNEHYKVNLIIICEEPPKLNIDVKKTFIKFNPVSLPMNMVKGDIFLAPRDISNPYNLGHSFAKIGFPMAVGLPVVASPVPPYLKSPAIICENFDSWYDKIESLIKDYKLRNQLGYEGIKYCKKYYSKIRIMKKYMDVFNRILIS